MARIFYQKDCDFEKLKNKKIAIIGYGSQGHAHALNLRDSGADVRIGLYPTGRSWALAQNDGMRVMEVADAVKEVGSDAGIVMLLVPDENQKQVWEESIAPHLGAGSYLAFGHGFNICFEQITPPKSVNVFMAAPKGPGHMVRRTFQEGKGVPTLVAVHQDPSSDTLDIALAWAAGIGGARSGVLETTFKQETETDLFGEQAVLCGGVTALMKAGFEILVEAGYDPENAYFECVHEMKLIVDLIYEGGFAKMRDSISNTAEYGDYTAGPQIITNDTKKAMKEILKNVQNGNFARQFVQDAAVGSPKMRNFRQQEASHPIETVGAKLRQMMSWIPKSPSTSTLTSAKKKEAC